MRGVATGPRRPWTPEEDEVLLEFYSRGQVSALAELLGRTDKAVRAHIRDLRGGRPRDHEIENNIRSRPLGPRRYWTVEEHLFVAETLDQPVAEVADCVNRSIFATQERRRRILNGEKFRFIDGVEVQPRPAPRRRPIVTVDLPQPTCPRCTGQHRGEC